MPGLSLFVGISMTVTENYLDEIFDEFKDKIVQINFYQGFAKSVSKTELINLNKEYERAKEQGEELSITHMTNMICKDILKGQKVVIGSMDASIEERSRILALHHNRQYQWLLVEAYEAFEDYLTKLYAYNGYLDNDFWEQQDFGEKTIDEIKSQDVTWFIKQAKKKKLKPESILKQVNKKIPALARILAIGKKNDPLNIDYEFMIILVSKFRHIIVHRHGITDKNKFINFRSEEYPLANKSCIEKQDYTGVINCYFGTGQLENLIALLEVPDPTSKLPIGVYFLDRLGDLLAMITSYAMLIHNLMRSHLEGKNHKVRVD